MLKTVVLPFFLYRNQDRSLCFVQPSDMTQDSQFLQYGAEVFTFYVIVENGSFLSSALRDAVPKYYLRQSRAPSPLRNSGKLPKKYLLFGQIFQTKVI